MDETHKKITKQKAQAEKSSHTMRVANADSDWDIHCFYLPRDPAVRPAASLFTGVAAMACEWG